MSDPADRPDELGSLAQTARKTSLKGARRILFFLAAVQMLFGIGIAAAAEALAKGAVANEVKQMGGGADADDIRAAEVETADNLRVGGVFLAGVGTVFLVLGLLVYKFPVGATVSALVIYVGFILVNAALDPTTLVQGVIIKVIVILALVRAVQAAVAYEREDREAATRPDLDPV